jgi:hypothetical protein
LNIESETYGTLLIPKILAKLPEEMQLLISRKVGKDDWKLDELLKEFSNKNTVIMYCFLQACFFKLRHLHGSIHNALFGSHQMDNGFQQFVCRMWRDM